LDDIANIQNEIELCLFAGIRIDTQIHGYHGDDPTPAFAVVMEIVRKRKPHMASVASVMVELDGQARNQDAGIFLKGDFSISALGLQQGAVRNNDANIYAARDRPSAPDCKFAGW
jgi:hypothetical protein